ncbi:hypothetical protein [Nitrosomonas communis]|uniref:hypothetical protein n=1 Tax=Nitrosomonas communis TaxID=44574 RepID=UPI003D285707
MKEEKKPLDLLSLSQRAGHDILDCLITHIRALPDAWQKLPKAKQDDVIEAIRQNVITEVTMAVHAIAADQRTVVIGAIEQVTIKDGAKAVIKIPKDAPNILDLCQAQGLLCIVVLANAEEHLQGMDRITGDDEQKILPFGKH